VVDLHVAIPYTPVMIDRLLTTHLVDALRDRPVALLVGPRQAGKTTLAVAVSRTEHPAEYLTLDDPPVLAAALHDPVGFLTNLAGDAVLDEAQLAPELFRPLKAAVDRDRHPGRFLLTGSAQVLLLPRLSESLAGRMEILTLWPFAQRELAGASGSFVDALFAASRLPARADAALKLPDVCSRLGRGGFPEIGTLRDAGRRSAWFESYVTTILQRDVREIANVEGLVRMPALLSLLAARSAALLNVSEISRSSGLKLTTLNRYLALLEAVFLVYRLPAWSANVGKRLVKAPKLHLVDTGLAAHLLGLDESGIAESPQSLGALLETFVVTELLKDLGWATTRARLYHFRSSDGRREVDVVVEDARGRVVGIEVRATSTPGGSDFEGLRALQALVGERFVRGVVLHLGDAALPFGDRLEAAPLSSLWTAAAAADD
jgi:predicted AAA+ superfamily ATPase